MHQIARSRPDLQVDETFDLVVRQALNHLRWDHVDAHCVLASDEGQGALLAGPLVGLSEEYRMVGAVPFDDQEALRVERGFELREQMRERHFRCLYQLDGSGQAARRLKFPERLGSVRGTHDDDDSLGTRLLRRAHGDWAGRMVRTNTGSDPTPAEGASPC